MRLNFILINKYKQNLLKIVQNSTYLSCPDLKKDTDIKDLNEKPIKSLKELNSNNNTISCITFCFIQNYKYAILRKG